MRGALRCTPVPQHSLVDTHTLSLIINYVVHDCENDYGLKLFGIKT